VFFFMQKSIRRGERLESCLYTTQSLHIIEWVPVQGRPPCTEVADWASNLVSKQDNCAVILPPNEYGAVGHLADLAWSQPDASPALGVVVPCHSPMGRRTRVWRAVIGSP
jgi:hypothetical protein